MYGINRRGFWVSKCGVDDQIINDIKSEMSMTPLDFSNIRGTHVKPQPVCLWRESSKKLYIPKYYGLKKFANEMLQVKLPCDNIDLKFMGKLREEQIDPLNKYLNSINHASGGGGILSLPCGWGKTVGALYIVSKINVRTVILVHKSFLIEQWSERIRQFLPGCKIGLVKADVIDVDGCDIVLASVQSISMKSYTDDIFDGFGLLIVDECHRLGTRVFTKALIKYTFKYTLGISATVDRKDGMTNAFVCFLGDIIYRGTRTLDTVVDVHIIKVDYNIQECFNIMGTPNSSKMINRICENTHRNRYIVSLINNILQEPNRRVLVLSDRKHQLREIHNMVGDISGFYWGGMKQCDLDHIAETKQVMLATYAFASEGMDIPSLNTLILASPKTTIEQSVGRILRAFTITPIVIDICDMFSIFVNQLNKRKVFYKKQNYRIQYNDLIYKGINSIGENQSQESQSVLNS